MRRTDRKRKTNGGFTLVELICVIAIMAILIAVAVPSYQNMQNKSAEQVAMANARSEYSAGKAQQALVDAQVLKPITIPSATPPPGWARSTGKRTPQHLTENRGRERSATNSVSAAKARGQSSTPLGGISCQRPVFMIQWAIGRGRSRSGPEP